MGPEPTFNASERLGRRYRWNSIALVVFSIYALALSIIPKYFHINQSADSDIVGFSAIFSSVFVVALSVYSAFSEDVVRGKYLHDNAKAVTNIYHEYKLSIDEFESKEGPKPETAKFEEMYKSAMNACPYNHDQIDYESIRSELEKMNWFHRELIQIRVNLSLYLWPTVAILGPPILMIVGFRFFVH